MSQAGKLFLVLVFAATSSTASSWWWNWHWDFDWSTEPPANCPHENPDTHVCSTLGSANATCVTIKCCSDFADDEDAEEYDDDSVNEDDETVHYLGSISDITCSLCYTIKPCSVYKCYRRCCEGYVPDRYGRCRTEGNLECLNGGSGYRDEYGQYMCRCPSNFYGKSCEIPRCTCQNGGICDVKDNQPYCMCMTGFEGPQCERPACSLQCYNGGVCLKNGTYEFCKCPDNFSGKQCERRFVQPTNCPTADYHAVCQVGCTGKDDCSGSQVCCREGCSTVCKEPRADTCTYEGRLFRVGLTIQRSACENCTCTDSGEWSCFTMSCVPVTCVSGRPAETQPGQCCPSCPEEPINRPPIMRCPDDVQTVYTSPSSNTAMLTPQVKDVRAYDAQTYTELGVRFRPEILSHPRCMAPGKKVAEVSAFAQDSRGNTATCLVRVTVLDKEAPRFLSCPEDIYVFDDEVVTWFEPEYVDNVGVAGKTCSSFLNGQLFAAGNYSVDYKIWDFDYNTATCSFRISVTRRDADQADVPQGLMARSKDKANSRLIIILAPVLGGVVLIALLVAMLLCCRRHRRRPRGTSERPPAYDNCIYAEPDDLKVKLPPYNSPSYSPPAYSISGSVKDLTYISLSPPSYTNPGYETLPAERKSDAGSVKI